MSLIFGGLNHSATFLVFLFIGFSCFYGLRRRLRRSTKSLTSHLIHYSLLLLHIENALFLLSGTKCWIFSYSRLNYDLGDSLHHLFL